MRAAKRTMNRTGRCMFRVVTRVSTVASCSLSSALSAQHFQLSTFSSFRHCFGMALKYIQSPSPFFALPMQSKAAFSSISHASRRSTAANCSRFCLNCCLKQQHVHDSWFMYASKIKAMENNSVSPNRFSL